MELKVDMPHTQVHRFTRQFLEPAQDLLVQRRNSWSFILRSRIRIASKSRSEKPTEDRSAMFNLSGRGNGGPNYIKIRRTVERPTPEVGSQLPTLHSILSVEYILRILSANLPWVE